MAIKLAIQLATKLAEIQVSVAALQQAELPIRLSGQPAGALAGLRLRAHLAFARSDAKAAAKMREQSEAMGDDRWAARDQQNLPRYLKAAPAPGGTG
ncbi:MAG: hypothetical protein WBN78_08395 [Gammaproteobacteria bacterium]